MTKKATYVFENKEVVFEYETNPKFLDIISMIEESVDAIVSDVVPYAPYLSDYMIQYNMIQYLTDIVMPSADINECYSFINESDFWDIMMQDLSELHSFIKENVGKMVKFRKEQILRTTKFDELLEAATHLISTISKEFEGLNAKEFLDRLEKIGLNPNMSEEKVVKTILQYHQEQDEKNKETVSE